MGDAYDSLLCKDTTKNTSFSAALQPSQPKRVRFPENNNRQDFINEPAVQIKHQKIDKAGHSIGEKGKMTPMAVELMAWREALSLKDVQQLCGDFNNDFTVAVLNAGAGLCTYSSVRASFRPVWFSEINDQQAKIILEFTNHKTERIRDTFGGAKPGGSRSGIKAFVQAIRELYRRYKQNGLRPVYLTTCGHALPRLHKDGKQARQKREDRMAVYLSSVHYFRATALCFSA